MGPVRPPGGGIRLDPLHPVGDAAGAGPLVAFGVQGGVDADRRQVGARLEQGEQPRPGAAAEVDDVATGCGVEPGEEPADHRLGHGGRDRVVGVGDAADLGAVHPPIVGERSRPAYAWASLLVRT